MSKEIINSKEYEAAEKAAEESAVVTTITLSKPVTYAGKTYEKFDLDFTTLTARTSWQLKRNVLHCRR